MENNTMDLILKVLLQNESVKLKNAQQKFVKMHYENAKIIGCKGFTNLMGKSYKIDMDEFEKLIESLSKISDKGTEIVFDYFENQSYKEIERMMSRNGYLIYEHLSSKEMAKLDAPTGFHFVLAVKKEHIK